MMHFHYELYGHALTYKSTPLPEVNFGRFFLGHHYYIGVENMIFKEIHQFTIFTLKLSPLRVGGHEIYNFLSPTLKMLHTKFWLGLAQ